MPTLHLRVPATEVEQELQTVDVATISDRITARIATVMRTPPDHYSYRLDLHEPIQSFIPLEISMVFEGE